MVIERARAPRQATGWDVAQLSGVSRSTVSQILSGAHSRFAPATRDRVIEAAAALNYRPPRVGRAPAAGQRDIIVVAVPHVDLGQRLQDAIGHLAEITAADGLSIVVRYAGDSPATTLATILDVRPVAVVDLGVLDEAGHAALHAVGCRTRPGGPSRIGALGRAIGRMQAEEVLRERTRSLVYALISDERQDLFGPCRVEAAADVARAVGVPEPRLVRVPLRVPEARDALEPALRGADRAPVGVCCSDDRVAIAVLAAARDLGLRVPEDVAVVGAGGIDVGQLITPRLTTVNAELADMVHAGFADVDWRRADEDEPDRAVQWNDLTEFLTLVRGESS